MSKPIEVRLFMPDDEAWAFAQMLKRIGWTEWKMLSADREECEAMRLACFTVQKCFADVGIEPR